MLGRCEGMLKSLVRSSLRIRRVIMTETLTVGPCVTALRISAHSVPTPTTQHLLSRAHPPPGGNGARWGEVWVCCGDVKKTCTLPIARPVQSNYSCWRPNAGRHGLRERECLVLVGRDHCAAAWMKGIIFFITKIRQAMKDTFFPLRKKALSCLNDLDRLYFLGNPWLSSWIIVSKLSCSVRPSAYGKETQIVWIEPVTFHHCKSGAIEMFVNTLKRNGCTLRCFPRKKSSIWSYNEDRF